jgi:hypothetical protein
LSDDLNAINEESMEDDKRNDMKETSDNAKPTGSSNRNIFSANKEKRKEKKEKKDKEKEKEREKDKGKHHKHSSSGTSEPIESIALNVLHNGLNLESKGSSALFGNACIKSPNSASVGNLENALDQLRLGTPGETIKSGSCVSDRTFTELDSGNGLKGSLSSSASSENVVNMHPKGK